MIKRNSNVIVGINGGHTHCTAVVYIGGTDERYRIRLRSPLNIHAEQATTFISRLSTLKRHLESVIRCRFSGENRVNGWIAISLPGVADTNFRTHAKAMVSTVFDTQNIFVLDDTWAGLFAVTGQQLGVCVHAGTGASVSVVPGFFSEQKRHKVDGWGPFIGDRGSGFQIALDYVRFMAQEVDAGRHAPLFEKVKAFIETNYPEYFPATLDSPDNVQQWMDHIILQSGNEWRAYFSLISIPLIEAVLKESQMNDCISRGIHDIVHRAVRDVFESLSLAIHRFEQDMPNEKIRVVLQGGLLRKSDYFYEQLMSLICERRFNASCSFERAQNPPAYGALAYAAEKSGIISYEQISLVSEVDTTSEG